MLKVKGLTLNVQLLTFNSYYFYMKVLYSTLVNGLIFFLIVEIFTGVIKVNSGTIADKILVGLLFGLVMAFVPSVLKFFKLPVTLASMALMSVILSFTFFFITLYLFALISITGQQIITGVYFLDPIVLQDKTYALVYLSLVSAGLCILFDFLNQKK